MGKTYTTHYCQYKIELSPRKRKIKTVVLGIGNILLGDEGVGVHAVRRLQEMDFPPSVLFIDGATAGFKLISLFEEYKHADFIIIDALVVAQDKRHGDSRSGTEDLNMGDLSDGDTGSIYVIPLQDLYGMDSSGILKDSCISFHQTSISDVLDFLYLSHKTRLSGYLIGINIFKNLPQDANVVLPLSMELSRDIRSLMPEVIDIVKKTVKKL